jgi:hypothetical protein
VVIMMMKWKHQIKLTGTANRSLRYTRLNYVGSDVLVFLVYLLCSEDLCSILEPKGIKINSNKLEEILRNLRYRKLTMRF